MVSVDPYVNETTRHADVLLAPASPLASDRFDVGFNAFSVRNVAKYSGPVFEREAEERHDWEIALGLWSRLEVPGRALPRVLRKLVGVGPRRWIDTGMRFGPHKLTVKYLERFPHGLDLGALEPRLVDRLRGRKMQLAPARFVADVPRLRALLEQDIPELVLIGRRTLRSNNSWMNNCEVLSKGKGRCTLMMNPADADALGINGRAVIESDVGRIEAPVVRTDELMRGVVSLPHGWGHHRPGTRLTVASARAGVSVNDVVDEQRIDALSGVSALNGQPVRVSPA
jgi:anaerobic selenocysteine-containing dehydrogenase